jgi:hypothetical protein
VNGRICYGLHNILPYSSGGYATRAHGVASALNKAGFEVIAVTRPGFPFDTKGEVSPEAAPLTDHINGVQYVRIPQFVVPLGRRSLSIFLKPPMKLKSDYKR